ncbi:uncharacterized protein PG986_012244 [Apiospora aurea]|uniref:Uncharacterized protein n=1 Tax=Apiospora aurea TaxID=335848 RepID=A0ABR1Q0L1_9PEZI
MDLYRAPVAPSSQPSGFISSGKKLRRKLQKIGSQQRGYFASNTNSNTIPEEVEHHVHFVEPKSANAFRRSYDTFRGAPTLAPAPAPAPQAQPHIPLPSNLSDSKWGDFPNKPEAPPARLQFGIEQVREKLAGLRRHSTAVDVPEFAHLSLDNPKTRQASKQSVSSDITHIRSLRVPPPNPDEFAAVKHRRHAKTPVHCIGQLEVPAIPARGGHQRVPSGDRIADSYKALLETRSFVLSDRGTESGGSVCGDAPRTPEQRNNSLHKSARQPEAQSPGSPQLPQSPQTSIGSPDSTDSTLVDSDEDTVYYKPGSPATVAPLRTSLDRQRTSLERQHTSLERQRTSLDRQYTLLERQHNALERKRISIERRQSQARSVHPSTTGNPSLQIAVDLLTRELSSAARGIPLRPSSETAALQVWVMIEAYEKLRDQVLERRMPEEQERAMLAMFDTWLESLQKIHDEMTGGDGTVSESVYNDALE